MNQYLHTPQDAAQTIGTTVSVALIQAAAALVALRQAKTALNEDNAGLALLIIDNYLTVYDGKGGTLTDLDAALYDAIPRHDNNPVSYG